MALAGLALQENYWDEFELGDEDIELLYSYLLEVEEPQTPQQLALALVEARLEREKRATQKLQNQGGSVYVPKDEHKPGDKLTFGSMNWQVGEVIETRPAMTFGNDTFRVIKVRFADDTTKEFASDLQNHALNEPKEVAGDDPLLSPHAVVEKHGMALTQTLVKGLKNNDDFVYIAGRWFPRALLVDVNVGNLNLAEAILDMNGGGPLPTEDLLRQVDLSKSDNERLAGFSLDLALQDDLRFDEVGSTGKVLWFLKRLEPKEVQETPFTLRYQHVDYDRSSLNEQMLSLERKLDDELSEADTGHATGEPLKEAEATLIYPHWRAGTLPITNRLKEFFPSAFESPRILFTFIDDETGEEFSGWVVRLERYVFGLRDWYLKRGTMPGSIIRLRRAEEPGRLYIKADTHRSAKEWVRTALVGADGGLVYATLKQAVETAFDDRMMVYMPSAAEALDQAWERRSKNPPSLEQVATSTLRELSKLNPQGHVHVAELYSALNVVLRCPPGPLMALLASRPWFSHVGDLHYRLDETRMGN
ncbi:MAG: hypothetical protein EPO32_00270 [Anaerolineae bacterium]|nr:MAG: hypothetical protein EPO32_00270 [Anaerolineae bacterium]